MGHWICDGNHFKDIDEMIEYAKENIKYTDPGDITSWVDETYDASEILYRCRNETYAENVVIDLEDEYYDSVADDARDDCEEGKDITIFDSEFEWTDEEGCDGCAYWKDGTCTREEYDEDTWVLIPDGCPFYDKE